MEQAELQRLRTMVEARRTELRDELTGLGANPDEDSMEGVDFDYGFADSAQSTAERGKVLAQVEHARERLRDVERALATMADGTYGMCENCGNPIRVERLEALPYSRLCVSCKQKLG